MKRKTYAAVMRGRSPFPFWAVPRPFADAEGFSEGVQPVSGSDGILSGDEAEELNENWMKSAIIRTLM